jgi:hypothetical protein
MCCKLMAVPELGKGVDQWCAHVKRGAGCGIYADRPNDCRTFQCEWLREPRLPESWRPDKTKFLIFLEQHGKRIKIVVDENTPGAWRLEPYYGFIKSLAQRTLNGDRIIVCIGARRIYVFPDQDIDLGVIDDQAKIHSGFHQTDGGRTSYAHVISDEEALALAKQLQGAPAAAPILSR